MRPVRSLPAAALLFLLLATPASAADRKDRTGEPAVSASSGESSATVKITYPGRIGDVPVGADPLANCRFHGPVNADGVRALLAVSVAARVRPLDDAESYAVVNCDTTRFSGAASAVWPIDEDPPSEVIDVLIQSAVARLQLPVPTPRSAPDGSNTPFLVNLPAWFWVDDDSWQALSATAGLGVLGGTVTARATPADSSWSPGDGSPDLPCAGRGSEWSAAEDDLGADCAYTYRTTTSGHPPLTLTVRAEYVLGLSCSPARLCNGASLPSSLAVSSSRSIHVTEARGVITG